MATIRRILVAVKDLNATSQPGIFKAAQIAAACGADVELFHSLVTPVYTDIARYTKGGIEGFEEDTRQKAVAALEKIAVRLRKHDISVTVAAEWDFPAYESVIRRALRIKADLIVIYRHEGRHILPWLMRLTDWELVRLSPIPVLLVKSQRPYRHPNVLVAVDPSHQYEKPLRLDRKLLQIGGELSDNLQGKLHAVHAYSRMSFTYIPPSGLTPDVMERVGRQSEQVATKQFQNVLRTSGIAATRRHLVSAHPSKAIPDTARKTRSAIVVMGAVSRRGFRNLLIGNTAERLLDELPCDVLVVKPNGFPNRVPRKSRGPHLMISTPAGDPGWF